jgi:hypothetical protein
MTGSVGVCVVCVLSVVGHGPDRRKWQCVAECLVVDGHHSGVGQSIAYTVGRESEQRLVQHHHSWRLDHVAGWFASGLGDSHRWFVERAVLARPATFLSAVLTPCFFLASSAGSPTLTLGSTAVVGGQSFTVTGPGLSLTGGPLTVSGTMTLTGSAVGLAGSSLTGAASGSITLSGATYAGSISAGGGVTIAGSTIQSGASIAVSGGTVSVQGSSVLAPNVTVTGSSGILNLNTGVTVQGPNAWPFSGQISACAPCVPGRWFHFISPVELLVLAADGPAAGGSVSITSGVVSISSMSFGGALNVGSFNLTLGSVSMGSPTASITSAGGGVFSLLTPLALPPLSTLLHLPLPYPLYLSHVSSGRSRATCSILTFLFFFLNRSSGSIALLGGSVQGTIASTALSPQFAFQGSVPPGNTLAVSGTATTTIRVWVLRPEI